MKRALLPALALTLPLPAGQAGAQTAPSGPALFTRCAACHTASGAGVPGAFPPLNEDVRRLAATPEGRRYLVLVLTRGLAGPITVEGQAYRTVMPAQGLDDAQTAAVLNHVGSRIAHKGPDFRPFDPAEVAAHRTGSAALSPSAVAALHAGAGGQ